MAHGYRAPGRKHYDWPVDEITRSAPPDAQIVRQAAGIVLYKVNPEGQIEFGDEFRAAIRALIQAEIDAYGVPRWACACRDGE